MRKIAVFLALFTLFGLPTPRSQANIEKTTVVLLDTSGSMRGEKLESAKGLLLDTLRTNQSNLEIYTFAEVISRISTVGRSYPSIAAEIDAITAGSRTSLYDAIAFLVPVAEEIKAPVVVISDGQDSQSNTSLESLNSLLQSRKVSISFIKTYIDSRYGSTVQSIVDNSRGELLTKIPNPESLAPLMDSRESSRTIPMAIGGASTLLFFILGTYFFNLRAARNKRNQVKQLLETSTVFVNTIGEEVKKPNSFAQRFTQNFLPQFKSDREKKFFAISALVIFVLLFLLSKNILFTLITTAMSVVLGMKLRLRSEKGREISAFERELPAALKMLAGSLSAGLSFLQALSAYAEDGHEVSSKEFRRALAEIQLGVPIERALDSIADRMESEDLRWAVSAFAIQREVGGSLATILNSTAETIESRFELRREIQTLSAEGRISSYILMALPIGIFIFLAVIRPNYIRIFITEPLGNILLVLTSLGLAAAWLWMKKLVRITI
jgi:Flp pilus assembly protein TadB